MVSTLARSWKVRMGEVAVEGGERASHLLHNSLTSRKCTSDSASAQFVARVALVIHHSHLAECQHFLIATDLSPRASATGEG